MALVASPYGLRPFNMIGGSPYNGGTVRQVPMTVNSANGIGFGDVVLIGAASAGQPTAASATPVAGTTGGVLGVCVGCSFIDPTLKQQQFANGLPANAVTGGYTNIQVFVNDDPRQLYLLQSVGSVADIFFGKSCALGNFGAQNVYGNSPVNGVAPANTPATLAMRIVGFNSPASDGFRDLVVKFNAGVLMWDNAILLAN